MSWLNPSFEGGDTIGHPWESTSVFRGYKVYSQIFRRYGVFIEPLFDCYEGEWTQFFFATNGLDFVGLGGEKARLSLENPREFVRVLLALVMIDYAPSHPDVFEPIGYDGEVMAIALKDHGFSMESLYPGPCKDTVTKCQSGCLFQEVRMILSKRSNSSSTSGLRHVLQTRLVVG